MELTQCRFQGGTLEDFYKKSTLLGLVNGLRSLPVPYRTWGLTYPDFFCLLAADDLSSPRYVKLGKAEKGYRVEYLVPAGSTPWRDAYLEGMAPSETVALRMALIGLKRSGGWSPFPAAQPSLAVVSEPTPARGHEVRRCSFDVDDFKRLCPNMRRFLASLRLPVRAWARMGEDSLELVTGDDPLSPTYVTIGATGGCYKIGCILPRPLGPWPGARVTGLAIMVEEAANMVVNAVKLSGGWEPPPPPRGPRRALHRLLSPAPALFSR